MKPLPHEIELQKVLDAIKATFPHFKVPPLYMFEFIEKYDRGGHATRYDQIALSMPTIGEFCCSNQNFVRVIVHEVVHLNCWEDGHNEHFWIVNSKAFDKVWKKINEGRKDEKNQSEPTRFEE